MNRSRFNELHTLLKEYAEDFDAFDADDEIVRLGDYGYVRAEDFEKVFKDKDELTAFIEYGGEDEYYYTNGEYNGEVVLVLKEKGEAVMQVLIEEEEAVMHARRLIRAYKEGGLDELVNYVEKHNLERIRIYEFDLDNN